MNPSYGIIIWLIIGTVVGWIGNKIMDTDARHGGVTNIFIGMLGAAVAGYLARHLVDAWSINGLLMSFVVAFGGACFVILAWTTLAPRRA
jgi:uncharacterized membrane protein YeaQ/YmgE (transglycosylase-associated protein family)